MTTDEPQAMTQADLIELLIGAIPYPDQVRDIDLSEPQAVRFRWRSGRYLVAAGLFVEECTDRGMLLGSDASILLAALLKSRWAASVTDKIHTRRNRSAGEMATRLGYDPQYVADVRAMADEWEADIVAGSVPKGDPDAGRHRQDDPETVAEMRKGRGA